jgi:flagellin-like hook-associated protein FlgL
MSSTNGAFGPEQRQMFAAELAGLHDSLLLVANSRNTVGSALFGGQAPGLAYQDTGSGIA